MSRIFSQATFKADSPADYRELARLNDDIETQHKALWRLFPSPAGTVRPFLYRHDVAASPRGAERASFWLLSEREPQAPDARWQLRHRRYAPVFRTGQQLSFELRIAPSVTRVDPRRDARPGKRVPRSSRFDPVAVALAALAPKLRADERQRWIDHKLVDWLKEKAERSGFTWDHRGDVVVSNYQPVLRERAERGNLRFSIADFRGRLQITNAELFTQAALQGVGHQRAFGCGLLLLRPLRGAAGLRAADDEEE